MELARRIFDLLRRRPSLLLPQMFAGLFNLLLNSATLLAIDRGFPLTRPLAHSVVASRNWHTGGSILRGAAEQAAADPLFYASYFIQITAGVCALAVMASIVSGSGMRAAVRSVPAKAGAIANASMVLLLLVLARNVTDLLFKASIRWVPFMQRSPAWIMFAASWLTVILFFAACVIVPPRFLLRVVRRADVPLHPDALHRTRNLLFLGVVAWYLEDQLMFLVEMARMPPGSAEIILPQRRYLLTWVSPLAIVVILTLVSVGLIVISRQRRVATAGSA